MACWRWAGCWRACPFPLALQRGMQQSSSRSSSSTRCTSAHSRLRQHPLANLHKGRQPRDWVGKAAPWSPSRGSVGSADAGALWGCVVCGGAVCLAAERVCRVGPGVVCSVMGRDRLKAGLQGAGAMWRPIRCCVDTVTPTLQGAVKDDTLRTCCVLCCSLPCCCSPEGVPCVRHGPHGQDVAVLGVAGGVNG